MTQKDIEKRQLILIKYIQELVDNYSTEKWRVKAEYSTNDNDKRVIVVQEQTGEKIVFYGEIKPMYNYYMVDIYGLSIEECKNISLMLGDLIGTSVLREETSLHEDGKNYNEKWQLIFTQWTNPQAIEYLDIRRVGYNSTYKCIVNKVYEKEEE